MKTRITATRSGLTLGALLLAMAAGACGDDSPTAPSGPTAPTLTMIQTQIFDSACTACHTDVGRTPSAGLNLKAGSAHSNLVGVVSTRWPGGNTRVIAGNASGSFLVQKLEGTQGTNGERMPRNITPLSDAQIKMIRDWITAGALNN